MDDAVIFAVRSARLRALFLCLVVGDICGMWFGWRYSSGHTHFVSLLGRNVGAMAGGMGLGTIGCIFTAFFGSPINGIIIALSMGLSLLCPCRYLRQWEFINGIIIGWSMWARRAVGRPPIVQTPLPPAVAPTLG